MKKIKAFILYFYANVILRFAKVRENSVLLIFTATHYDNSLAMYRYLQKAYGDTLTFCLLVDPGMLTEYRSLYGTQSNVKIVSMKKNFLDAVRELVTNKYVFFMHRKPFHTIKKRPDQVVVNLWHGFGYKTAGVNDAAWRDGKDFDYVLVPGPAYIDAAAAFFLCGKQRVLPLGYPRYDVYGENTDREEKLIRSKVTPDHDAKIVIWMPTFRKTGKPELMGGESEIVYNFDLPLLNNAEELTELDRYLKEARVMIVIKRHPYQLRYQCEGNSYSNIKFISNEDLEACGADLYRLLTRTDALISDYSSVAVDYLLLDKPMAFSLDDYEQYKDSRGFIFENMLDYMPGHHLYNAEDLKEFIADVSSGADPFREQRAEMMKEVQSPCDGYAARIWDAVK